MLARTISGSSLQPNEFDLFVVSVQSTLFEQNEKGDIKQAPPIRNYVELLSALEHTLETLQ